MRFHHHRHQRRPRGRAHRKPCRLRHKNRYRQVSNLGSKIMTRLVLDKANKKILGVCAGLANWSGMDPFIVRLIFVAATLIGFGSPVLIYILLAMIFD